MTDEVIMTFIRVKNPNGTEGDVKAFRLWAEAFEIKAETPAEVHEQVLAKMDALQLSLHGKSRVEQAIIVLNSGLRRIVELSRGQQ